MAISLFESFGKSCGLHGPLRLTITPDGGQPADYAFEQPYLLIGRGRLNDLQLDDPAISLRHAYIQVIGGHAMCIDLGSRSGIRHGGHKRVAEWLSPDEDFRIGPFAMRLHLASPADPDVLVAPVGEDPLSAPTDADRTTQMSIEIHPVHGAPAYCQITQAVSLVGRAAPCRLRGADESLSAYHCALVNSADEFWLIDLLSSSGTKVNGRAVRMGRLKDGDVVRAGEWYAVVRRETISSTPTTSLAVVLPPIETSTALAEVPEKFAESVASAFMPFQSIMEQFQQCMMMMGKMFATMQQEHMSMVREQIGQLQEVARDLTGMNGAAGRVSPANFPLAELIADWPTGVAPTNAPAGRIDPQLPTPNISKNGDIRQLTDAHAWFMDRLAALEQMAGGKK